MYYILAIIILGFLIFIHETGHFVAARLAGIPIRIFSLGFGPALIRRQINETEYRISAIPLGGYVLPDVDELEDYMSFSLARRWIFSIGGPLANLLATVMAIAVINCLRGSCSAYYLFVYPWMQLGGLMTGMISSFSAIFSHPEQLSSVVGIVAAGEQSVSAGAVSAFSFFTILSINLTVFNLLPLPPLDGGKMILDLLHRVQPRLARIYMPAVACGWLLLAALVIYATIQDIAHLV